MIAPLVVFPDAELVAVTAIRAGLTSIDDDTLVTNKVPADRPASFVKVFRTGGARQTMVSDFPEVTVESWAPTDTEAHDRAQLARAYVHAMRGTSPAGVPVYKVTESGGPVNLPDPDSKSQRYTFTAQISMRGQTP